MTTPVPAGEVTLQPPKTARWEDFIDLIYAPAQVFRRRLGEGFGIPMLIVTVAMAVLIFATAGVLQPVFDTEFNRGMAAAMKGNPALTPDALERARHITELFQRFGAVVLVPVGLFVVGLVTWLVGKLVDSRQTLTAAILVASYAWVPRVIEGVVNGVQGLLLDTSTMTGIANLQIGPARFFDPATTSPLQMAILTRFDVFILWETALVGIGIAVTGKVSARRATIAAVIIWILGALPGIQAALKMM